ncbi:MAG: hypothetical protein AVDCRST_MAG57-589, partial [uncultured Blastococcus sp.]
RPPLPRGSSPPSRVAGRWPRRSCGPPTPRPPGCPVVRRTRRSSAAVPGSASSSGRRSRRRSWPARPRAWSSSWPSRGWDATRSCGRRRRPSASSSAPSPARCGRRRASGWLSCSAT